jgi:hypothetical protein
MAHMTHSMATTTDMPQQVEKPQTNVYLVLGYDEWQDMKRTGRLDPLPDPYEYSMRATAWLRPHVAARASMTAEELGDPIHAFLRKPKPHHLVRISPAKLAVLKVRLPASALVLFDAELMVCLQHDLENGRQPAYMSLTRAEAAGAAAGEYGPDEIEASRQRVFVPECYSNDGRSRERAWCGDADVRAYVPVTLLTRAAVRKTWIYGRGKRLRGV